MTRVLDWIHATTEVGERGLARTRPATDAERAEICAELGLLSCSKFNVTYELRAAGGGRYRLHGTLDAHIEQTCVVSLEPVPQHLAETFEVEFDPAPQGDSTTEKEHEILTGIDVEPIENGEIDIGRVVLETVSAVLDPYPRKDGADFGWTDPKAAEAAGNPFAVLKKLKDNG
jgi:uncharacterized metal-binding protein YceD (DUF177 family)